MIKEAYCSYEISKLLKERGFVESCYGRYSVRSKEFHLDTTRPCNNGGNFLYCAPTHQMAMAWLREVHNIHISVYVFNRELPITDVPISYTCDIATKNLSSQQGHLRGVWQSYEQAVEAAIKYCLENLI